MFFPKYLKVANTVWIVDVLFTSVTPVINSRLAERVSVAFTLLEREHVALTCFLG